MSKKTALWMMIGGAALSGYDLMTTPPGGNGGDLYGAGKPLEKLRFEVHKNAAGKQYFVSVSDAAAVIGAFFYFS